MRRFGHVRAEMFSFTAQKALRYLLPLFLSMWLEIRNKQIFQDGLVGENCNAIIQTILKADKAYWNNIVFHIHVAVLYNKIHHR